MERRFRKALFALAREASDAPDLRARFDDFIAEVRSHPAPVRPTRTRSATRCWRSASARRSPPICTAATATPASAHQRRSGGLFQVGVAVPSTAIAPSEYGSTSIPNMGNMGP